MRWIKDQHYQSPMILSVEGGFVHNIRFGFQFTFRSKSVVLMDLIRGELSAGIGLEELTAAMSGGYDFYSSIDDRNGYKKDHFCSSNEQDFSSSLSSRKLHNIQCDSRPCPSSALISNGNPSADCEIFSTLSLKYISKMLLEEEEEEEEEDSEDATKKSLSHEESLALRETEEQFYEALQGKYPDSSYFQRVHPPLSDHKLTMPEGCMEESPQHSYAPDSNRSALYSDSHSISMFKKGREEACRFLPPSLNFFTVDLPNHEFFPKEAGLKGRKNPHPDDLEMKELRSNKQTAISIDEMAIVRSEMWDKLLLSSSDDDEIKDAIKKGARRQLKGLPGKKRGCIKLVDLMSLLLQCAQEIAGNNWKTGSELLGKIKKQSSPTGDGPMRLAHYFAQGLEARLSGTGSEIYKELGIKTHSISSSQILMCYQVFMTACPFLDVAFYFANQTILDAAENAAQIHIVDYNINFGFQWPSFLQRLGRRPGGPPKLRITAIDFPQPGLRPSGRLEATGRHLVDYAQTFGIPFEYVPISCSRLETIRAEDLSIEKGEVLIVNSLFQFHKLAGDALVETHSPRDIVLKMIKEMKPEVFIHGVINGAYDSPFFLARFKEALLYWSTWFEMVEANVTQELPERELLESIFFGREALNIIACEGAERIERPETYNQWQRRTLKAGFKQLPLNQKIMQKAELKMRSRCHKEFLMAENKQWLLQGWKGRILYALSTWKPCDSG